MNMDDPLRDGPHGFRLLLERSRSRMNSLDSQALLPSLAKPLGNVNSLAQFLNCIGVNTRLASLKAASLTEACYISEAWRLLAPEIAEPWAPPGW